MNKAQLVLEAIQGHITCQSLHDIGGVKVAGYSVTDQGMQNAKSAGAQPRQVEIAGLVWEAIDIDLDGRQPNEDGYSPFSPYISIITDPKEK